MQVPLAPLLTVQDPLEKMEEVGAAVVRERVRRVSRNCMVGCLL